MHVFSRFLVVVLAAALVAVLLVLGVVAALILVPVLAVLVVALRWSVLRHAARFRQQGTIIEGVAIDVTVEPAPDDDRTAFAPPRPNPE